MLPKLGKFQPRWLEEPVIADDIDGYAELNAMNIVPISGGEHEFGLYGFKQLLDRKAVSVVQYDTNRVGDELFYYIFDGEPVAENGFLQLDDDKPGLGLTLKTEYLDQFNIIE